MKRFGSIRNAAIVLVFGGLVAAFVAVASAQAAPSKKNYTLQVAVTKPSSGPVNSQNFTVTLANDKSSNTTLGSANVTAPAGFTVDTASMAQTGWTATPVDNVIQLRSAAAANALAPGNSMTVSVHVSAPPLPTTCASAAWSSAVKQSNDFNGTNNSFSFLAAGSDLKPLGSFEIEPIGRAIDVTPFFTPAILLEKNTWTTTAYDTCHNVKTNYSGADLTHVGLTGATITPSTSLSWSSGVGSVDITPVVSETGNSITVTDPTTGISDTSNVFDTQQKICTSTDTTDCTWSNGHGINASAPKPDTGSLGVGFNPNITFTCNNATGGTLGNTVITIAPHDTPNGAYQVTLVFSKQVSGTGNANAFIFCESIDEGATFNQLPSCATVDPSTTDCVLDQKRITGGALQVILNLLPGDPYVGGR